MLFTVANLMASGVADKKGGLACLFIAPDGSTFATDRRSLIVVEPCPADSSEFRAAGVDPVPVREGGVAVPLNTVKDVLSDIPKQPLRHIHKTVAMSRCDSEIEFSTTRDGVSVKKNSVTRARTPLPDVKDFLRGLAGNRARVCISLKRLKNVVDSIDKMCGGDDTQPVYMEVGTETDPVSLRAESHLTGQRIIGVVTTVELGENEWWKPNQWERRLLDQGVKRKQEKRPVTRKGGKRVVGRRHFDVEI